MGHLDCQKGLSGIFANKPINKSVFRTLIQQGFLKLYNSYRPKIFNKAIQHCYALVANRQPKDKHTVSLLQHLKK